MFKNSVSVIIPNFNDAPYLEKVVDSCFSQGGSLKEVIVVDDHSTDDSLALLKALTVKYPEKMSYYINPDKGGNSARNYGFSKSAGDFIQWLDADDFLLPGKFDAQLESFRNDDMVDVVYSDWYMDLYDDSFSFLRREVKKKKQYPDFTYELLIDNWSANNNYLYKRRLVSKLFEIKAWKPNRKIAQDREYVTLAALSNAKFSYTSGFFSVYNRRSRDSVSSMDFKQRLRLQLQLEDEFRDIIQGNHYPASLERKYLSALNAHAMNACFYAPSLVIKCPFSILNIDWKLIHYKKYPFILLIYVWQHIKYYYVKLSF